MHLRVAISHRIHDEHHVVTEIIRASPGRFHSGARRNPGQKYLRYAVLAQSLIERSADERSDSLLRHNIVTRLLLQFRNKLGAVQAEAKIWERRPSYGPGPCLRH
jgi:hypothetical protein